MKRKQATKKPKLLSCPWCGGKAMLDVHGIEYRVSCPGDGDIGCGVLPETGWRSTEDEAVDAWNTRAKSDGR